MKTPIYNSGRLRAQRAVLRLTNEQIAEKAGLGIQTVSNILNARGDNPGIATLASVAKALGLSLVDILSEPEVEVA